MQWLKVPKKVYFKKGCMPVALDELATVFDRKNAFIVTDNMTYQHSVLVSVQDKLDFMGIKHTCFFAVGDNPTLSDVALGKKEISLFAPDVIIAVGGGSVIDFAKMLWLVYEHPDCDILKLAETFHDISRKDELFPTLGNKADFVAVPVLSSTGAEVSPVAVISDNETKITLADYQFLPTMAIIDADNFVGVTAYSGVVALFQALEAYVSENATDYTDGFVLESIRRIFTCLSSACDGEKHDSIAIENIANAFAMSGIAFGNAYTVKGKELAEKLAVTEHISYAVACARVLIDVIRERVRENTDLTERYCECAVFCGVCGKDNNEIMDGFIRKIDTLLQLTD